ncbi:MAG: AI-2E family transporter [Actinophytocola sp.]|uniref:AI-2E family transporter n=1 Tax=Actinophytocola sp. TaxID=1872138 RepID=UPI003D6A62A1
MTEPNAPSAPSWRTGRVGRIAVRCLQFLLIALTVWVVGQVLSRLAFVMVPVAVAILLAALFVPGVAFLAARGVPRWLATTVVLLGGVGALGALVLFMVTSVVDGLPDLGKQLNESLRELRDWLTTFGLSPEQLDNMISQAKDWLSTNRSGLVSGVFGVLSTAGTLLVGLLLALFLMIFFVHDGARLWRGLLRPLPESSRGRMIEAGERAFRDLTSYVRTTLLVALIDAIGIGLGLWITGVPLVLPLAGLVFLGAFVPVIGAFVTGIVAVLVALVTQGPVVALIVAAVVVAVQQLEGNVLEPLLMSRAVKLHPVAVILGVAIGAELAGVVGALLAVPVMTTVRSATRPFFEDSPTEDTSPPHHPA